MSSLTKRTPEEQRIDKIRFSYSAGRGWSCRYNKDRSYTDEFKRELAGTLTWWDHVKRLFLERF